MNFEEAEVSGWPRAATAAVSSFPGWRLCCLPRRQAPHEAVGAEPGSALSPLLPWKLAAILQHLTGSFASS